MSEEKICPFMSGKEVEYVDDYGIPKFKFLPVQCQGDKCMAWGKMHRCLNGDGMVVEGECGCRLIP